MPKRGLIAVFLLILTSSCARDNDAVVLKLAHSLDPNHAVHKAMVYMGEQLDEISGGQMQIEVFPSGQLGSERETVELVQIGSIAMTKVSTSPLEAFVPRMKVFSIPYVFNNRDHYFDVLDSQIGKDLLVATSVAKLRGLGYYDAGSRSFYTTEFAISAPADLAGLKIRVQKSQTSVQMVAALGGSATPISWGELYTALQQGVVDGAENNPPSFYLSGHYEISKFYSLDEHTYVPDILLVGENTWDRLNPQQQAWLQESADRSVLFQRELWTQATQEALDAVIAAGVVVSYPDKRPFRAAVEEMQSSYQDSDVGQVLSQIAEMGKAHK